MSETVGFGDERRSGSVAFIALQASWIVALVASLGALFVGEVMGQAPCDLCWYQRAMMFPLAVVLGIAVWRNDAMVWRYALPLAGLGLAVAAFHTLVYAGIVPEAIEPCGKGPSCSSADMTILGGLPLPVLSVAAFAAVVFSLFFVRKGSAA